MKNFLRGKRDDRLREESQDATILSTTNGGKEVSKKTNNAMLVGGQAAPGTLDSEQREPEHLMERSDYDTREMEENSSSPAPSSATGRKSANIASGASLKKPKLVSTLLNRRKGHGKTRNKKSSSEAATDMEEQSVFTTKSSSSRFSVNPLKRWKARKRSSAAAADAQRGQSTSSYSSNRGYRGGITLDPVMEQLEDDTDHDEEALSLKDTLEQLEQESMLLEEVNQQENGVIHTQESTLVPTMLEDVDGGCSGFDANVIWANAWNAFSFSSSSVKADPSDGAQKNVAEESSSKKFATPRKEKSTDPAQNAFREFQDEKYDIISVLGENIPAVQCNAPRGCEYNEVNACNAPLYPSELADRLPSKDSITEKEEAHLVDALVTSSTMENGDVEIEYAPRSGRRRNLMFARKSNSSPVEEQSRLSIPSSSIADAASEANSRKQRSDSTPGSRSLSARRRSRSQSITRRKQGNGIPRSTSAVRDQTPTPKTTISKDLSSACSKKSKKSRLVELFRRESSATKSRDKNESVAVVPETQIMEEVTLNASAKKHEISKLAPPDKANGKTMGARRGAPNKGGSVSSSKKRIARNLSPRPVSTSDNSTTKNGTDDPQQVKIGSSTPKNGTDDPQQVKIGSSTPKNGTDEPQPGKVKSPTPKNGTDKLQPVKVKSEIFAVDPPQRETYGALIDAVPLMLSTSEGSVPEREAGGDVLKKDTKNVNEESSVNDLTSDETIEKNDRRSDTPASFQRQLKTKALRKARSGAMKQVESNDTPTGAKESLFQPEVTESASSKSKMSGRVTPASTTTKECAKHALRTTSLLDLEEGKQSKARTSRTLSAALSGSAEEKSLGESTADSSIGIIDIVDYLAAPFMKRSLKEEILIQKERRRAAMMREQKRLHLEDATLSGLSEPSYDGGVKDESSAVSDLVEEARDIMQQRERNRLGRSSPHPAAKSNSKEIYAKKDDVIDELITLQDSNEEIVDCEDRYSPVVGRFSQRHDETEHDNDDDRRSSKASSVKEETSVEGEESPDEVSPVEQTRSLQMTCSSEPKLSPQTEDRSVDDVGVPISRTSTSTVQGNVEGQISTGIIDKAPSVECKEETINETFNNQTDEEISQLACTTMPAANEKKNDDLMTGQVRYPETLQPAQSESSNYSYILSSAKRGKLASLAKEYWSNATKCSAKPTSKSMTSSSKKPPMHPAPKKEDQHVDMPLEKIKDDKSEVEVSNLGRPLTPQSLTLLSRHDIGKGSLSLDSKDEMEAKRRGAATPVSPSSKTSSFSASSPVAPVDYNISPRELEVLQQHANILNLEVQTLLMARSRTITKQ